MARLLLQDLWCSVAEQQPNIGRQLTTMGYVVKEEQHLTIVKTTDSVTVHRRSLDGIGDLWLKGAIWRTADSALLAPGCPVPLQQPRDNEQPISYSLARDGVMYRFYYDPTVGRECWNTSTTGRIYPDTRWGPKSTPTFQQLIDDAITAEDTMVDFDRLCKNYCYYVILEHPKFTNVVKHKQLCLTLVHIVDVTTLQPVALEADKGFTYHDAPIDAPVDAPIEQQKPRPLGPEDVGYIMHYADGNTYRHEFDLFEQASVLKPNLAHPLWQWVELLKDRYRAATAPTAVAEFLEFFPWYTDLFSVYSQRLSQLIREITADANRVLHDTGEAGDLSSIPKRFSYMRTLISDFSAQCTERHPLSEMDVMEHLLSQDARRITFLLGDLLRDEGRGVVASA